MRDDAGRVAGVSGRVGDRKDMLDHLQRLFDAATVEDVWALHVAYMAQFGFDRLIYGLTRFSQQGVFGSPHEQQVLTNHDPDYIEAYLASGAYQKGYMVKWAAENEGACSWSVGDAALRAGKLSADERAVADLNRRYGVVAGYAIGFRKLSARSKGGISLCAARGISQRDVDETWGRHGTEILVANQCMHLRVCALPNTLETARLTSRQRDVLERVGQGMSIGRIAIEMGLTASTVEKHMRLARAALGVETTAQAVLKAALNHRIYVAAQPAPKPAAN